ncbi:MULTISPECIES: MarR family winged helix-turn-helix transcriptional regulator [Microbacterium]|uniref:MarR family winged helix-turn-helix transcriptional regulator n=1 Tax=Microbacterium TaxID=33882 RepID=UPI0006F3CFA7|nr:MULTISPECIES: MarR family transcriptional regulator [Microbacterium]KQR21724.1 transcriptional regulator [Microbacterium sp. Leaf151]MCI9858833.1 MarR family transcriptional regulator [Microbacterium proteolyticum]
MAALNSLSMTWSDLEVAVMHRLRDWTMASDELNRHLSTWMGLPASDAEALGQIVWAVQSGEPVAPAQLARQIGMTSGAVSVLIDRLERAGHVTRRRDDADRRRVTLHPTATALEGMERFLGFAGAEVAAATRETTAEELRIIRVFLDRMTDAAAAANARLRETPAPHPPRAPQR